MGFEAPLWRSVAVFRVAALIYASVLIVQNIGDYRHPVAGGFVLAVMVLWTAYAGYAYADPARRTWPLLVTDLVVATGCLLATVWVETGPRIREGVPTLPMAWVAGAVLAWAVSGGKRRGAVAALVVGTATISVHGLAGRGWWPRQDTFNGAVLVFLAGIVVGHVAKLGIEAESRLARAIELEAATRERERLARRIHDSVLQVLTLVQRRAGRMEEELTELSRRAAELEAAPADGRERLARRIHDSALQVLTLVQRRGGELGGEAAELGRLAGEQEAALRALVGYREDAVPPGADTDLRALLAPFSSTTVTVSSPATPVRLPAATAKEIEAAVAAALDNVQRHCGQHARAWVLLEDGHQAVTVSVRDEGPGIPAGRLAAAAAGGRLGVAQSIQGRIRDLGGEVSIVSAPGEGTEIEMSVPLTLD